MIQSAVTISLVPQARGGPFVFWEDLPAACKLASALGFDAVEIFPPSAEALDARLLRSLLDEHRLKLAAIGTGAGWLVHKLRLTDPDLSIRRRAHDFVAAVIDFAGRFGASTILGSMQGRYEGEVSREEALDWFREGLEQLGPRAQAHGVPLLYEPLNRYETNLINRVDDALALLGSLRTGNIQLLCDLFHMNIEEADVAGALKLAGPKLGHVHFADSNRQAIGLGHLEVAPIVQALGAIGFSGYVSAEVFPMPDAQAAARQTIASFRKFFPRGA